MLKGIVSAVLPLVCLLGTVPVCDGATTVDVYILSGQSNAVGFNDIGTYTPGPFPAYWKNQPNVLFWPGSNAVGDDGAYKNKWTNLQVGPSGVNGTNAFGPEITFGYDMAAADPTKKIAIVKYAVGGAGIGRAEDYHDVTFGQVDNNNNFHPDSDGKPAGNYYAALMTNVTDSLKALKSQGYDYRIAGFLWMQGEREANDSLTMAQDYGNLLSDLIESVRSDLGCPNMPVVVGQISDKWKYHELVQAAQSSVGEHDIHAGAVTTSDLPRTVGDDSHYTANGMAVLGSRFATEMQNLQKVPEPGAMCMLFVIAAAGFGIAWKKRSKLV